MLSGKTRITDPTANFRNAFAGSSRDSNYVSISLFGWCALTGSSFLSSMRQQCSKSSMHTPGGPMSIMCSTMFAIQYGRSKLQGLWDLGYALSCIYSLILPTSAWQRRWSFYLSCYLLSTHRGPICFVT